MVSVAVSKLGKTDLIFVQPGAKINSVYYCENIGYSNKVYCRQFAVSRTTSSCSSRTLVKRWDEFDIGFMLIHCSVPMVI